MKPVSDVIDVSSAYHLWDELYSFGIRLALSTTGDTPEEKEAARERLARGRGLAFRERDRMWAGSSIECEKPSMSGESLLAALEAGSRALRDAGFRFALTGDTALPAWGRTRATGDADILIGLGSGPGSDAEKLERVVEALRKAGFAHLERADRRRIQDKEVLHFWFPLRDQGLSLRLDVIHAGGPEYEEVLDRTVLRKVDGFSLAVASCEDLILLKLAAGRPVDLADARALIEVNQDALDRAYFENRAAEKGLLEALRGAQKSTAASREGSDSFPASS